MAIARAAIPPLSGASARELADGDRMK